MEISLKKIIYERLFDGYNLGQLIQITSYFTLNWRIFTLIQTVGLGLILWFMGENFYFLGLLSSFIMLVVMTLINYRFN
jgi:hypothetical protein